MLTVQALQFFEEADICVPGFDACFNDVSDADDAERAFGRPLTGGDRMSCGKRTIGPVGC